MKYPIRMGPLSKGPTGTKILLTKGFILKIVVNEYEFDGSLHKLNHI
jgi:hypothetical protein